MKQTYVFAYRTFLPAQFFVLPLCRIERLCIDHLTIPIGQKKEG